MPAPPTPLPAGKVVNVPGRGEMFVRDSGGDGPAVLLLHGWMFGADLNWWPVYEPLADAGYRVLAIDHRGHGRGLRTPHSFKLADCAADAAGLLRVLGIDHATVAGYSMGGPIACLMARDFPEQVDGLVVCATSHSWKDARSQLLWRGLGLLRLSILLAPERFFRELMRINGAPDTPHTSWVAAELARGNSRMLAEAGMELSRYDGRPWLAELGVPAASIITTHDRLVDHARQRELAELLGASVHPVAADHFAVGERPGQFRRALLAALAHVQSAAIAA